MSEPSIHPKYQYSEIELTYTTLNSPADCAQILHSGDAYVLLLDAWDMNKIDLLEQAKVILLNRSARVLGVCNISSGGTSGTVVDIKHVLAAAVKANASSLILAHNHPSGNLEPSSADREITHRIKAAGDAMWLSVNDHLIISRDGYYSMSDERAYELSSLELSL